MMNIDIAISMDYVPLFPTPVIMMNVIFTILWSCITFWEEFVGFFY